MPGYVVHVAIAQEYLKKHSLNLSSDFIEGSVFPDSATEKSKTHYGKSPAYTNLKNFLENNQINTDFQKGHFLHLVTDYLFYNYYLDYFEKPQIYDDYDFTNKLLIDKYNVILPSSIQNRVFFKVGTPKILTFELACKIIDEISNLSLEKIEKEILNNNSKWNYYKKLI